jgi:CHAT domain-containing protein
LAGPSATYVPVFSCALRDSGYEVGRNALRLSADWIVLSACNTAARDGAGADAVWGLGRAFFYAGARALLVSNWPVETMSARALTTRLFRQDPLMSRAEALQATMKWMIDEAEFVDSESGKIVFSYAHPIFWAPFTIELKPNFLRGAGVRRDPLLLSLAGETP